MGALADWPVPSKQKKLQQFMGFAHFYRKFIRNFSTVAAPLHTLTSSKAVFQWSPGADTDFQRLKTAFTTVPVLTMPDPQQFVVEVDTSNEGVGAVLSQHNTDDNKIHPCAYLSRKLSPAERKYDGQPRTTSG